MGLEQVQIKKNTILNVLKTISTIIFPLLTFLFASRVLGAEGLGKVKFANSIVNYVSLLASLGIGTYGIRECSKVRADNTKLSNLASQLFSLNIYTTILSYGLLGAIILFWPNIAEYRTLILVQSCVIIFTTLGADWLNTAMEDFLYITLRTFLSQMIALIAVFTFVHDPEDYFLYALIMMLAASGGNIANIFYRKKYCNLVFHKRINVNTHLKPILFLFSMSLAQSIYVNVDSTMLGLMRSDYEVGLYAAAVNIYNIINQVVASIAYVVMPSMSVLFEKKDYKEINRLLTYSFSFIILIGFPCITGATVLSREMLFVMGGIEYVEAAPALMILCVALLGSFFAGFVGNIIMLPSGREKLCLISSIISASVNFALNLFLISKYGIIAAAITTAIAQWIGLFVKWPFVERAIKIDNIKENTTSSMLGCIIIVITNYVIKLIIHNMVYRVFIGVVVSVILYFAVLLLCKNSLAIEAFEKIARRWRRNV